MVYDPNGRHNVQFQIVPLYSLDLELVSHSNCNCPACRPVINTGRPIILCRRSMGVYTVEGIRTPSTVLKHGTISKI